MKSRFMVTSGVLLAFVAIAVLLAIRVRAQENAEGTKSSGEVSGTLVSATFDFDHADLSTPANVVTFTGSDPRFGRVAGQYLGEFTPDGLTCTPPGGVAGKGTEFILMAETGVVTRLKTGSQLFFTATSGKQCIDFSASPAPPFPFNLSKTDSITGGTGEFTGATGTLTTEGSGAILAIDPSHHVFGWVQIKYDARINLP
ncbi:MAG: hypothetical protein WBC04_09270 [Candidatus Acidiferrales bacterium]